MQSCLTWGTVPVKSKMTLNPHISKLKRFEFRDTRIESRVSSFEFRGSGSKVFEIIFVNHVAVQKFAPSISGCSAVYCNCLNCQLRQPFNTCKSIFLVSKIYPACTVYVAFARHVLRFSQMNSAAWQFFRLSWFYANLDKDLYDKLSLSKSGIFTSIWVNLHW